MTEFTKGIKGYITLRRKYPTTEMRTRLYAGLTTYRKVTKGPSVNPMDYMFSTKTFLDLSTAYGFDLYAAIHLPRLQRPIKHFTSIIVGTTYSLYQATMQGNEIKKADSVEAIMALHKDLDEFLEVIPSDIQQAVNSLSYNQIVDASLEKRMERILEKRD